MQQVAGFLKVDDLQSGLALSKEGWEQIRSRINTDVFTIGGVAFVHQDSVKRALLQIRDEYRQDAQEENP